MTHKTRDVEGRAVLQFSPAHGSQLKGASKESPGDTQVLPKVKPKTSQQNQLKRPPKYKVLLHNDDYTPREFVVAVLRLVFHRQDGAARAIMLYIHRHGIGIAGIYTKEIAETKMTHVMTAAERAGHPLLCTMSPAEDDDDVPGSTD